MSDAPQTPQVIDLELILQPISDELPSGESLRYSGLYDEISEARRADDNLNQGDWHGYAGIGAFTSSQQAYDTLHIGDPAQAAKLQSEERK